MNIETANRSVGSISNYLNNHLQGHEIIAFSGIGCTHTFTFSLRNHIFQRRNCSINLADCRRSRTRLVTGFFWHCGLGNDEATAASRSTRREDRRQSSTTPIPSEKRAGPRAGPGNRDGGERTDASRSFVIGSWF